MFVYSFELFFARCELHINTDDKDFAGKVAYEIYVNAKDLEGKYGFYQASSQLYPLNYRTSNLCVISDELSNFIKLAKFYADVTKGAFDIALAGTLNEASSSSSLKEYMIKKKKLLPFASLDHITIDGNLLRFDNNFTKIDLGGLIKEYAVDESIFFLKQLGIEGALVNFGGDLSAYGKYNGASWNVGVQNPDNASQNILEVGLNDNSLCTSGHLKHFHMIEDTVVSHIISNGVNPYSQISVLAPSATDAGVWSTALLINPDLILPSHITCMAMI